MKRYEMKTTQNVRYSTPQTSGKDQPMQDIRHLGVSQVLRFVES
jgi:hypothetical protein